MAYDLDNTDQEALTTLCSVEPVMVVGQKIALGRVHAHKTVTIDVTDTDPTVHCDDGVRTFRRTTDHPVTQIKAHRPRKTEAADSSATA